MISIMSWSTQNFWNMKYEVKIQLSLKSNPYYAMELPAAKGSIYSIYYIVFFLT